MKSILLASSKKSELDMMRAFEIAPDLLDKISGGCSCAGKHVTKTPLGDGVTQYTVDADAAPSTDK
jgi:hypothetical protein